MKKINFFLILVPVVFIFACHPVIPSGILITGTPELKFAANMDFSDLFENLISGAFNGGGENLTLINCKDVPDIKTFLIHMHAINHKFKFDAGNSGKIIIGGHEYNIIESLSEITLNQNVTLFDSEANEDDQTITLPLSEFNQTVKGFKFNTTNVKTKLYIFSGNNIIEDVDIELKFVPEEGSSTTKNIPATPGDKITLQKSGIDLSNKEFAGTGLPTGGYDIDIANMLNDGHDYHIEIKVILPSGSTFNTGIIGNDVDLSAELVIWMPLSLKSNSYAEISIGDFGGVGSFISSLNDFMNSLTLTLEMNNPIFHGGEFSLFKSPDLGAEKVFSFPMNEKIIFFEINENNMEIMKELEKPDYRLIFNSGATIDIPTKLILNKITLEASINYKMDF